MPKGERLLDERRAWARERPGAQVLPAHLRPEPWVKGPSLIGNNTLGRASYLDLEGRQVVGVGESDLCYASAIQVRNICKRSATPRWENIGNAW